MNSTTLTPDRINDLERALAELPVLDAHTHLTGNRLGARGLHDVLLYHMLVSDLYSAGCPSGERLSQFPDWPGDEEAHGRIREALPFLPRICNTSMYWGLKIILRDLYDWNDRLTADNWQRLDAIIRERRDDRAWHDEILDRVYIGRTVTELARRGRGEADDRLQYALEWGFFTRCQWGEFDTALYELERCWGREPESSSHIGSGRRPQTDRTIRSLDDVHDAVRWYVDAIPCDRVFATATHFSTDIDYSMVSDDEMTDAISRRAQAGPRERDLFASYINECFLTELEKHSGEIVFQFSLGAEPLPYETGSRIDTRTIAQVAEIVHRHPHLQFQCLLASRHANQSLCTLARALPNLCLAGYWWHNFFPDTMRQVMAERLDMLPVSRQIGFFSDAYSVEWTCGKLIMVRRILASVLTEKIAPGQYGLNDAISIAKDILYESPKRLLGIEPRIVGERHE